MKCENEATKKAFLEGKKQGRKEGIIDVIIYVVTCTIVGTGLALLILM